jgi:hypothetical protein
VVRVVAGVDEQAGESWRQILIDQEPHALRRIVNSSAVSTSAA